MDVLHFSEPLPATLLSWKVKEMTFVKRGQVLCEVRPADGTGEVQRIRAPKDAVLRKIMTRAGDAVSKG
jgi:biotin carboxyl carrier protein